MAFFVHSAEVELGVGVTLLGKGTQLANGRRVVAALIGCRGLNPTSPSRCRQAQRKPGAQRRDKRKARECGFGVVMVLLPVEVTPEYTTSRIEYQSRSHDCEQAQFLDPSFAPSIGKEEDPWDHYIFDRNRNNG